MQPWQTVDRALAPGGIELVLARRGAEWVVRAAGFVLMSSRVHGSEETLVKYALERVREPRRVLVGGLGFGFTLRAALAHLPSRVPITVVELVPELIRWNRTHLASLAGSPLEDPRVEVLAGDVYESVLARAGTLDVLVLDVDNGPAALTQARNGRLYSEAGARKCADALDAGGVLAVWSATTDARYKRNLEQAGLAVEMKTVPARSGAGARDVLFLATKATGHASGGSPRRKVLRGPSS